MTLIDTVETWLEASAAGYWLIGYLVKATVILSVAWGASWLLRRSSAAARHQLWTVALLAILVLPLLSTALPGWHIALLSPLPTASTTPQPAPHTIATSDDPASRASHEGTVTVPTTTLPVQSSTPETASSRTAVQWFVWVWALGAGLFLLRLLISALAARKLVSESVPVADPALLEEVEGMCLEMRIDSPVRVVEHPRLSMPMAWGVLRQTVLLPTSASDWTSERRRVVLLHELAHLKRWDCQTLLLARVTTALHWFNPLVWVAVRRLQAEREHACDDLVLTAGTPGSDYAQHLLDIARAMKSSLSPGWAMVAMARPSELEGRLLAILDPHLERVRTTGVARFAIAVVALAVLPLAVLQPRATAQTDAEDSPATAVTAESARGTGEAPVRNAKLLEAFASALADEDPDIREQAAHSLGSLDDSAATSLLATTVREDSSAKVREQAAWALGMIGAPAALDSLLEAVANDHAAVRKQALWAVGQISN